MIRYHLLSQRAISVSYTHLDHLTDEEISYYVNRYEVLDKAGAYGIQDWIGLIGVKAVSYTHLA